MNKRAVGFFILCLVIGSGISVQARVTKGEHAFVSAKVLEDNQISMQTEREEIDHLQERIREMKVELAAYKEEDHSSGKVVLAVEKQYEEARKAAGFTKLQGPGVSIVLDDGVRELYSWESANDIIVHDLDLLMLLEELKQAGAEAISINGERYMSTTAVSCAGHTVQINGKIYARPFFINAIGDPASLYAAMTVKGSYGSVLTECGLVFEVKKKEAVTIPAYTGKFSAKYMENMEERDTN